MVDGDQDAGRPYHPIHIKKHIKIADSVEATQSVYTECVCCLPFLSRRQRGGIVRYK